MSQQSRYWELDCVRAVALCLMLFQHVLVMRNLVLFSTTTVSQVAINVGRVGAMLFLLLVGISGYISYYRRLKKTPLQLERHFFVRGLMLLGCGAVISVLSYLVIPASPVYFGVLSFIGTAVMLLPFFIQHNWLRITVIIVAPALGYLLRFIHVPTMMFLPLGLHPAPFHSLDYWPLLPWITVVLLGSIIGEELFPKGVRQLPVVTADHPLLRMIQWVGSHTLSLYLLHLPLLYSIFWLIKQVSTL